MSYEAELLRLLRQASIESSVMHLRLIQEWKERMGSLAGSGRAQAALRPDLPPDAAEDENGGALSDLIFELTRYSVSSYEHWLRLNAKQLDLVVELLGGRRRTRHEEQDKAPSKAAGGDIELETESRPGATAEVPFRVQNSYPFRSRVSFGTVALCRRGEEAWIYPAFRFCRAEAGVTGDDFLLAPNEEARFKLLIYIDESQPAARYHGEAQVLLESRVVGRLLLEVEVRVPVAAS